MRTVLALIHAAVLLSASGTTRFASADGTTAVPSSAGGGTNALPDDATTAAFSGGRVTTPANYVITTGPPGSDQSGGATQTDDSATMVPSGGGTINQADGVTTAPPAGSNNGGTTATSGEDGNTAGSDDRDGTTAQADDTTVKGTLAPTVHHCYECNGTSCAEITADFNDTCVNDDAICWMYYDTNKEEAARSCEPFMDDSGSPSCPSGSEHPDGRTANGACQYCCTEDKCNDHVLTKAKCDELLSSAPSVGWQNFLTTLLFSFSVSYCMF